MSCGRNTKKDSRLPEGGRLSWKEEIMIILHVTYQVKEGCLDALLAAMEETQVGTLSRQEAGNRTYRYFRPLDAEDQVFLVEEWESQEALHAHKETAHYRKWMEAKKALVASTEIQEYRTR